MTRLSIKEAAKELGTSPAFIRSRMKSGALPIGKCIKGKKRNSYFIYKELIQDYMNK